MAFDTKILMKLFSPKITGKAMETFDRATTIVVGACWGGAVLMMAFGVYTMTLSISAKRDSNEALAVEPSLPRIVEKNIDTRTAQAVAERLGKRFPDLNFSVQNNQGVVVTAIDGSKFRQWLSSLSYIDTIAPEYNWAIQQFCVGKCHGGDLMRAALVGKKVSIEAPPP
ncbi:MAG: hypothetical protein WAO98_09525 [Alphaproteobacteria bacterium]